MAIYIKNKTRLSFTVAVDSDANSCTNNNNQDAVYIGATDPSWNCQLVYQEHGASSNKAVNTYYTSSSFNSSGVWTGFSNIDTRSLTQYGDSAYKVAKNYGIYYKATCSGGESNLVERLIPNIELELLNQYNLDLQLKLSFPAYITGLTGITATFRNLTRGTNLGSVSAAEGNYVTFYENILGYLINEYEVRFTIPGVGDAYATVWIEYDSNNNVDTIPDPITPKNSFFQLNQDSNSCIIAERCLPINSLDDLQMQLVVDTAENGVLENFQLLLGDGVTSGYRYFITICNDGCEIKPSVTNSETLLNKAYIIDWVQVPLTNIFVNEVINWSNLVALFNSDIKIGDCFSFCLVKREPDVTAGEWIDTVLGCSNCFQRIDDTCFTSVISYRSNDNNFCFYYSQDSQWNNKVRLPMFMKSMQPERKTKGYQKSNGTFVKLSDKINEAYTLKIGDLNADLHKKVAVALASDSITITDPINDITNVAIFSQDDYKINWNDEDTYTLAQAETKVYLQNNNCSVNSNC